MCVSILYVACVCERKPDRMCPFLFTVCFLLNNKMLMSMLFSLYCVCVCVCVCLIMKSLLISGCVPHSGGMAVDLQLSVCLWVHVISVAQHKMLQRERYRCGQRH